MPETDHIVIEDNTGSVNFYKIDEATNELSLITSLKIYKLF